MSIIYTLTDKQSSSKFTVEVAGALVTMDVDTGAFMTDTGVHIQTFSDSREVTEE